MLGLIKKDLLMIKSNIKILIILIFVYSVMAFQGEMDLSFIIPFMSVMIMISTFSYDSYNKWDAYAVTLPEGRKNVVKAKYIATAILIIISTVLMTIISISIAYARTNDIELEKNLSLMLGSLFATVLVQAFMYPTIYKFGVEKARIGIFIAVFGITMIGTMLVRGVDFSFLAKPLSFINEHWLMIIPITIILMWYLSLKLSEKIYKKKEF